MQFKTMILLKAFSRAIFLNYTGPGRVSRAALSRSAAVVAFIVLAFSVSALAQAKDWLPISQDELSMTKGKVDPNADAEILFWEVKIDDSSYSEVEMTNYVRVKIFNERGRDAFSKIDLEYTKFGIAYPQASTIKNIKARVIRPDGTITDVTKTDIFDRDVATSFFVRFKAKSFAVPNLEPGSIIEYRYKKVVPTVIGMAFDGPKQMVFQGDYPMESKTYYFKPFSGTSYLYFNMKGVEFVKRDKGYYSATMTNMPAIRREPYMPPLNEVQAWVLPVYGERATEPKAFWNLLASRIAQYPQTQKMLQPSDELKADADQLTKGAATDQEKLDRIYDFCTQQVKNTTYKLNPDPPKAIGSGDAGEKPTIVRAVVPQTVEDVFKSKNGTDGNIDFLFASLAVASGLDARWVYAGDRSDKFFSLKEADPSFIGYVGIGVKIDGKWQFFDPGDPFLPKGSLPWEHEATAALVIGKDSFVTMSTPFTDADKTVERRTGRFALSADGTLEGTMRIEDTGQLARTMKVTSYRRTAAEREEAVMTDIRARLKTAEISDVKVDMGSGPQTPFAVDLHIKLQNYAQKTGKRMFVQPGVFVFGVSATFPSSTRTYPIFFPYGWTENDDIEIKLPDGYELEAAETPQPEHDTAGISSLSLAVDVDAKAHTLRYRRDFFFGKGGRTLFPVSEYAGIKTLFDHFFQKDNFSVSLRQL